MTDQSPEPFESLELHQQAHEPDQVTSRTERRRTRCRRIVCLTAVTLLATLTAPTTALAQTTEEPEETTEEEQDNGIFDGTVDEEECVPTDDEPCEENQGVSRWQAIVWMVRLIDGDTEPELGPVRRFNDIGEDHPWVAYIERAAQLGITRGCGNGNSFCPNNTINRGQMSAFIVRGFRLPSAATIDPDADTADDFQDVNEDDVFAEEIAAIAAAGITLGCGDGTEFCAEEEVTLNQVEALLERGEEFVEDNEEILLPPTTTTWLEPPPPLEEEGEGTDETTETTTTTTIRPVVRRNYDILRSDTVNFYRVDGLSRVWLPINVIRNDRCYRGCHDLEIVEKPDHGTTIVYLGGRVIEYVAAKGEEIPTSFTITYKTRDSRVNGILTININAGDDLNDDTFGVVRVGTDAVDRTFDVFANDKCLAECLEPIIDWPDLPFLVGTATIVDHIRDLGDTDNDPDTPNETETVKAIRYTLDEGTTLPSEHIIFRYGTQLGGFTTIHLVIGEFDFHYQHDYTIQRNNFSQQEITIDVLANSECLDACAGLEISQAPEQGTATIVDITRDLGDTDNDPDTPNETETVKGIHYELAAGVDPGTTRIPIFYATTSAYDDATIIINIENEDKLKDDTITLTRSGLDAIEETISILDNDICDSHCRDLALETDPTTGTATLNDDNTITFRIPQGTTAPNQVRFTYKTDNHDTPATVRVNIRHTDVLQNDTIALQRPAGTAAMRLALDVFTNDVCGNQCLNPRVITQPSFGTLTPIRGKLIYNVPAGARSPLAPVNFSYATDASEAPAQGSIRFSPADLLREDSFNILRTGTAAVDLQLADVTTNDTCLSNCAGLTATSNTTGATLTAASGQITLTIPQGTTVQSPITGTYQTATATDDNTTGTITIYVTQTGADALQDDTITLTRFSTNAADIRIPVLTNDSCGAGCQGLTINTGPTAGTATVNVDNTITYQIATGTARTARDTFTYSTTSDTTPNTVTINFTNADQLNDDYIFVDRTGTNETNGTIDVFDNDICDGTCSGLQIISSHSTVNTTAVGNTIDYSIPADYTPDSSDPIVIAYASDTSPEDDGLTNNPTNPHGIPAGYGTVVITITDAAETIDTLTDDTATAYRSGGTGIASATIHPLRNDDCESGCEDFEIVDLPDHGNVRINIDGSVTYSIDASLADVTSDYYTYTTDDANSAARVDVTIAAADDLNTDYLHITRPAAQANNNANSLAGNAGTGSVALSAADIADGWFKVATTGPASRTISVLDNDTCTSGCANLRIVTQPAIGVANVAQNGTDIILTIPNNAAEVGQLSIGYTTDGYTPPEQPRGTNTAKVSTDEHPSGLVLVNLGDTTTDVLNDDIITVYRRGLEEVTFAIVDAVTANDGCGAACAGLTITTQPQAGTTLQVDPDNNSNTNNSILTYRIAADAAAVTQTTFEYRTTATATPATVTVNFVNQDVLVDDPVTEADQVTRRTGFISIDIDIDALDNDICTNDCAGLRIAAAFDSVNNATVGVNSTGDMLTFDLPVNYSTLNPYEIHYTTDSAWENFEYATATVILGDSTKDILIPETFNLYSYVNTDGTITPDTDVATLLPDSITIDVLANDLCFAYCVGLRKVGNPPTGRVAINPDSTLTYTLATRNLPDDLRLCYVTTSTILHACVTLETAEPDFLVTDEFTINRNTADTRDDGSITATFDVLANDVCSADCKTLRMQDTPQHGSARFTDRQLVYTLPADADLSNDSTDTLTYVTRGAARNINNNVILAGEVTINILQFDEVSDDEYTITRDATEQVITELDITDNDLCWRDCQGLVVISPPRSGTVALNDAGDGFTYTLANNEVAYPEDSFRYTTANALNNQSAEVTLNIEVVKDILVNDTFTIPRHSTTALDVELDILGNDGCGIGNCAGLNIVNDINSNQGTLDLSNGVLTYSIADGVTSPSGSFTFTYTTTEDAGDATVTLELVDGDLLVDDDPDTIRRVFGNAIEETFNIKSNDACAAGCNNLRIVDNPAVGTATLNGDDSITFKLGATVGATTVTITYITDKAHGNKPATLTLNLSNVDYLADDRWFVYRADTLNKSAGINPFTNDICQNNICSVLAAEDGPQDGSVSVITGTTFEYNTGNTAINEIQTITYSSRNTSEASEYGTVTVVVAQAGVDALNNDTAETTREGFNDASITIPVGENDACGANCAGLSIKSVPGYGTAEVNADGTITYEIPGSADHWQGGGENPFPVVEDTFTYTTTDVESDSNQSPATVTISLTSVSSLADDVGYKARNGTEAFELDIPVHRNDFCPSPGRSCNELSVVSGPNEGTATPMRVSGEDVIRYTLSNGDTITNPVQRLTYTTFTGGLAEVTIIVAPPDEDTLVDDFDTLTRYAGSDASINFRLTDNDACLDFCESLRIVDYPTLGTLTAEFDGSYTYTIASDAAREEFDYFTYTTSGSTLDSYGLTGTATATVVFDYADNLQDDIVIVDTITGSETVVNVDVFANDNCIADCAESNYRIVVPPTIGTAQFNRNTTRDAIRDNLRYEISNDAPFTNPIRFAYATEDAAERDELAWVEITLATDSNSPTLANDVQTLPLIGTNAAELTFAVLDNDICPSSCANVAIVSQASDGAATANANGTITYRRAATTGDKPVETVAALTTDTFTYSVDGTSETATVTIVFDQKDVLADDVNVFIDRAGTALLFEPVDILDNDDCTAGCSGLRVLTQPQGGGEVALRTLDDGSQRFDLTINSGETVTNPLLFYYTTGTAWETRDRATVTIIVGDKDKDILVDDIVDFDQPNATSIDIPIFDNDACNQNCANASLGDPTDANGNTFGTATLQTVGGKQVARYSYANETEDPPNWITFTYSTDDSATAARVTVRIVIPDTLVDDGSETVERAGTAEVVVRKAVLDNDSCDGGCADPRVIGLVPYGTAHFDNVGNLVWWLRRGETAPSGPMTLTYTTRNADVVGNKANFTITVNEIDVLAPVSADLTRAAAEEVSISVDVLSNAACASCSDLTIDSVTPDIGTAAVNDDGVSIDYTIAANVGTPSQIEITFGTDKASEKATLTINVAAEADFLNNDTIVVPRAATEAVRFPLSVLDNDWCGTAACAGLVVATNTAGNEVAVRGTALSLNIAAGVVVADQDFTYTTDHATAEATVSLDFRAPDVLTDGTLSHTRNGTAAVTLTFDPANSGATCAGGCDNMRILTEPTTGTATVGDDNIITYTIDAGGAVTAQDTFRYTTAAAKLSKTVTINFTNQNTDTLVADSVDHNRPTGTEIDIDIDVTDNDTCRTDPANVCQSVTIVNQPNIGTVTVNADNTVNYYVDSDTAVSSDQTFTYSTHGTADTATVTISITEVVRISDDSVVVDWQWADGVELTITVDVLNNDDCLGTCGAVSIPTQPSIGTATVIDYERDLGDTDNDPQTPNETETVKAITYTHDVRDDTPYGGQVMFDYIVGGDNSRRATVTINFRITVIVDTPVDDEISIGRYMVNEVNRKIDVTANDDCYSTCGDLILLSGSSHPDVTIEVSDDKSHFVVKLDAHKTTPTGAVTFEYTTSTSGLNIARAILRFTPADVIVAKTYNAGHFEGNEPIEIQWEYTGRQGDSLCNDRCQRSWDVVSQPVKSHNGAPFGTIRVITGIYNTTRNLQIINWQIPYEHGSCYNPRDPEQPCQVTFVLGGPNLDEDYTITVDLRVYRDCHPLAYQLCYPDPVTSAEGLTARTAVWSLLGTKPD